ncbi:hypothetical protein Pcinc_039592, partial [Petrolisthes cinctipes]
LTPSPSPLTHHTPFHFPLTTHHTPLVTTHTPPLPLTTHHTPSPSPRHHTHPSTSPHHPPHTPIPESPARKKINIDIRKLSERGAPLLFFPIRAGHVQVVRELRRHGASLYTQMLDDDMVDVPVIFSALEPWMEADVVKSLLPASNSREARLLERVWHRGKNILRQAVERGVHIEAIEAILEVGGAALLSERDPVGQTTLDYCLTHDLSSLVALFDLHVAAWLTRPDLYPARRDLLALRGYGRLAEVGSRQVKLGQDVSLFLQEYRRCQGVLGEMFAAVREGEGSRLHNLLQYHSHLFHLVDLLWHGRLEGDGMTLLHWAVLHGREGTVGLILRAPHTQTTTTTPTTNHTTPPPPTLTTRFSVDDIRDGWGRTPLHYAAGLVEGRGIEVALLHHGCSEHTLDMNGREPLDFKDARGSPALAMLLHNLRNKVGEGWVHRVEMVKRTIPALNPTHGTRTHYEHTWNNSDVNASLPITTTTTTTITTNVTTVKAPPPPHPTFDML